MKRRFLVSIFAGVLLLTSLSLAGCGNDTKEINTGGGNIQYSENENKSVALPDGYPSEDFPIYEEKDSFIAAVQAEEKSFIVTCFSKDKKEDIIKFYQDLVADGQIINQTDTEEGFLIMGIQSDFIYSVLVADNTETDEMKDFITVFSLTLTPAEPGMPGTSEEE